jgi:hypothetical protein
MNLVVSARNSSGSGPGGGSGLKETVTRVVNLDIGPKSVLMETAPMAIHLSPHNPSQCNKSNGQKSHNICQQGQEQTLPPAGAPLTKKQGKGTSFQLRAQNVTGVWTTTHHMTNTHTGKKSSASGGILWYHGESD